MHEIWKQSVLSTLSLFTSFSTLICCALPALFVMLGMGATLAGLVSVAPWLIILSDNKVTVFIIAGTLLALSTFMQWRSRNAPCPADPMQAQACKRLRVISSIIIGISIVIYAIGFFFAFLASSLLF